MVKVTLDVTGFFYSCQVDVPSTATIKDVMDAAVAKNTNAGLNQPLIRYKLDSKGEFLEIIAVLHRGDSAKSRQTTGQLTVPRVYPDGIYIGRDDPIERQVISATNERFVPVNPAASIVHAWQYYVYKQTPNGLVDVSRTMLGGTMRKVDMFSTATPFNGASQTDEFEIVWRLVGLALRPTQMSPAEDFAMRSIF